MTQDIREYDKVNARLIIIRQQPVLLDRDVASIFGVETKRVNEAVRRNADKFPPSYRFQLQQAEIQDVVAKCDRLSSIKFSTSGTYAFTEKGLYMLATVLKSPMAVEATFEIIETFAAVKDLQRNLINLHNERDPQRQKGLMTRFSEVLSDIVLPDLKPDESETSLELNFLIGKLKHTVKRKRRSDGPDIVEEPEAPYDNQ